mmetsp:Transcript_24485/g.79111  ORF Transcript_24485/g.79111 Transcript_24485/m.79111 type:complete len:343 (-) Transcript_24485:57-1085(-)
MAALLATVSQSSGADVGPRDRGRLVHGALHVPPRRRRVLRCAGLRDDDSGSRAEPPRHRSEPQARDLSRDSGNGLHGPLQRGVLLRRRREGWQDLQQGRRQRLRPLRASEPRRHGRRLPHLRPGRLGLHFEQLPHLRHPRQRREGPLRRLHRLHLPPRLRRRQGRPPTTRQKALQGHQRTPRRRPPPRRHHRPRPPPRRRRPRHLLVGGPHGLRRHLHPTRDHARQGADTQGQARKKNRTLRHDRRRRPLRRPRRPHQPRLTYLRTEGGGGRKKNNDKILHGRTDGRKDLIDRHVTSLFMHDLRRFFSFFFVYVLRSRIHRFLWSCSFFEFSSLPAFCRNVR